MKRKLSLKSLIISLFLVIALVIIGGLSSSYSTKVSASQNNVYDLSEWQGKLNDQKAHALKNEVSFVILRAQYGNNYQDRQFQNSLNLMTRHQIPYGVYSYSLYHNNQQARNEASALYNRAPQADFYVNDIEQNNAGRRISSATNAWAKEMKSLTSRPVVLYSYSNFIQHNLLRSRKHYDAVWLASYTNRQPATGYKYDLWQYTSKHYSKALRQKVDASVLNGDKPLSFWIGNRGQTDVIEPVAPVSTRKKFNKRKVTKKNGFTRRYGYWLNKRELRQYHHDMTKVRYTVMRGHRLSRHERRALKIYKLRHGHNYRL